jgi:hypothetical protein
MEGHVNRELDPAIKQQLIRHGKGWRGLNNPWMAEGEGSEEFQYINLVVNPERYTGYKVGVGFNPNFAPRHAFVAASFVWSTLFSCVTYEANKCCCVTNLVL